MVLLDRLEKFEGENAHFSNLQFVFQEGIGCLEASFTILESVNNMFGKSNKLFACFLAFDTVWTDLFLQAFLRAWYHSIQL